MDRGAIVGLVLAVAFLAGGTWYAVRHGAFTEPPSATKTLGGAAILFVFLAVPLAVLDGRAKSRFARESKRLRAERPDAVVSDYAGPEGDGLLFDDAAGRVLLLRPVGGFGAPRVVALPPVAPEAGSPSVDQPEAP